MFSCGLYIVASRIQLTLPFFYPTLVFNGFSAWVSFSQSEPKKKKQFFMIHFFLFFNLGTCCSDDLYFWNLLLSFQLFSIFSYMFLSFPPSRGGRVNLAGKPVKINRSLYLFYITALTVWNTNFRCLTCRTKTAGPSKIKILMLTDSHSWPGTWPSPKM